MKKLVIISFVLWVCLRGINGFASDWTISRITDNDYTDYGVRIYENKLTWHSYIQSGSSDIFYYDGTQIHQLTDSGGSFYNIFPEISSGGIVWVGNLAGFGENYIGDVCFYDYNSVRVIAEDCVHRYDVGIFENKIVWSDATTGQIMLYDGVSITPIPGAYGSFPRISSGGILYITGAHSEEHVYLYDWTRIIDLGFSGVPVDKSVANQQINGDKVVWFKQVGGYSDVEVMLYDISTGQTTQITHGNILYGQPSQPSVSGNYIAWEEAGCGEACNYLKLYDGQEILTLSNGGHSLSFGDGFLCWTTTDNRHLYEYDLTLQETTLITSDGVENTYVVAYGNNIAWRQYESFSVDNEIYVAYRTPGLPNEPPIAEAGENITAEAGKTVTLDGSGSYDPDGSIVNYEWKRLPDDVTVYTGSEPTCEIKALGRVEEVMQLTVTDDRGAIGVDTMKIINRKVQDLQDDVDRILSYPMFKFRYKPMGSQHPYIYKPEVKSKE